MPRYISKLKHCSSGVGNTEEHILENDKKIRLSLEISLTKIIQNKSDENRIHFVYAKEKTHSFRYYNLFEYSKLGVKGINFLIYLERIEILSSLEREELLNTLLYNDNKKIHYKDLLKQVFRYIFLRFSEKAVAILLNENYYLLH